MNIDQFGGNILEQISGLIVIMDQNSKFIYANQFTAQEFGYKDSESMLGIDAFGMRCPAVDSAEDFIKQDRFVRETGRPLTLLDIHTYASGNTRVLLTRKTPYRHNNCIIGTLCHCVEVNSEILTNFCSALMMDDNKFHLTTKNDRSYSLTNLDQNNTLSQREQDCVFYLVRGKTMKEIAKNLGLSWRTVETYLESVKLKWRCATKGEIVEAALSRGYLTYVPQHILSSNVSKLILA